MESKHLRFKHPFTCMVCGPTSSGKTYLVRKLLQYHEDVCHQLPSNRILWCYGQWQCLYKESLSNVAVKYMEGLPDADKLAELKPALVVIDDLMTELADDKRMTNLFTKGSHHMGISVIFIVQNLFYRAKEMRTISCNTNYFVLLKNPRDKLQIECLGRQMYPRNKGFFGECYQDATNSPFGYLIVDCRSDTPDNLRLRTNIFPCEDIKGRFRPIVYTPI